MITRELKSHAKINVGLRILGKREDGFHDLETIFYPIRLHDLLTISLDQSSSGSNSVILKTNRSYVPLNRENLCYKAAEAFFREFHITQSHTITIDIQKTIPVSGGLGGGSSNAAAIIRFLTRFFGIDVNSNRKRLIDLAGRIGSDVPFFLLMRACYAEGRGELMRVLPDFRIDHDILIVNPNVRVSTKWAFEKLNMKPGVMRKRKLETVSSFDASAGSMFRNDFEEVVFRKFRELREIKDKLIGEGAVFASMSGSGSTIYGFFSKEERRAYKLVKEFAGKGSFTFLC